MLDQPRRCQWDEKNGQKRRKKRGLRDNKVPGPQAPEDPSSALPSMVINPRWEEE